MVLWTSSAECRPTLRKKSQPSEETKSAIGLFEEATSLYEQGRFREAIDVLLRVQALNPDPILHYNLARAYEGVGELDKAIVSYRAYLAEAQQATDRPAVAERIRTIERQMEEAKNLKHKRGQAEQRARQEAEKLVEARKRQAKPSAVPWIVAGVGGAGLLAGAGFGLLARSQHAEATDEPVHQTALDKQAGAERSATVANVAVAAGGIVGAVGVVWGVLDLRRANALHTQYHLSLSGDGLRLGGSF